MKKLLFVMVVSMAIFNCSTDSTSNSSNLTNGNLLKTVKETRGGFQFETLYEYNSMGNVIKITTTSNINLENTEVIDFFYDSNNVLVSSQEVSIVLGDDPIITTNQYSYENNLITEVCSEIEENGNSDFRKMVYTYNNMGYLTQANYYYGYDDCTNVTGSVFDTFTYDANGNLLEFNDGYDVFIDYYYVYTYDDKNSPYTNVKPEAYKKILEFSTKNNITSGFRYRVSNDELGNTYTYEYDFNTSDYPTKLTEKTINSIGVTTVTKEYEYY